MCECTSKTNESTDRDWTRHRHLRGTFRAALAVAVAVLLVPERHTLLAGARRLSHVSPQWLLLAVGAEVVAFLAAAEVQRLLLAAVGFEIGRLPSLRLVSAASSVGAALPAGVAFSAGYTYRQLTRRGAGNRRAAWVLIAGGVLSGASLVLLGLVGAELCGRALVSWAGAPVAGVGVLLVAGAALAWLIRGGGRPSVARTAVRRLAGPGVWTATLGLSTVNWLADLGVLGMAFLSLGVGIPWRGLLLAYAVGQVAASLPLLPGSLGVAEAAMALALVAVGTRPAAAVAVVLVYRLISFWLPLPVGLWCWARDGRPAEGGPPGVPVGAGATARLRAPPGPDPDPIPAS